MLIIGRGGGSLEDLWAFNDERLARKISGCPIPIVSAVGHEIDFTIADFVADVRAPTPSGAAEIVVPDRDDWLRAINSLAARVARQGQRVIEDRAQALDWLSRRLLQSSPQHTLHRQRERLREMRRRLAAAIREDFLQQAPQFSSLAQRLHSAVQSALGRNRHRLELAMRSLHSVSPLATLERGYAIVEEAATGKVLLRGSDVSPGDDIRARLARGELIATVKSIEDKDD